MLLLDTHVAYWWTAMPERLSADARQALRSEDVLAVSAYTWLELAWMVRRDRIAVALPMHTWLNELALSFETLPLTPAIAATAALLPDSFPRDPGDRTIYATAIEHGCRLVTSDGPMRAFRYGRAVTLW